MTFEGKIFKHTAISLAAYLITYTLSTSIILSIIGGISLFETVPALFIAYPMMFTGNLLPSLLGYGVIYLCNKIEQDNLVITRSRFFTLLAILVIEFVGTIVYYANVGKFVGASFAIIAWLIIDTIKTNKKYKELKNPPAPVEDEATRNDDLTSNDEEITKN